VKEITKQVQKQHDDIVKNSIITVEEKKSRVEASKSERDAKLAEFLTPGQVDAVKAKDPVDWKKINDKIDSREKSRLKSERDQKLKDVDRQMKDLESRQDDIKKQMNDLKRKQKDLDEQQKALKRQKKNINAEYK
jgi:chromosome segregation ATPase